MIKLTVSPLRLPSKLMSYLKQKKILLSLLNKPFLQSKHFVKQDFNAADAQRSRTVRELLSECDLWRINHSCLRKCRITVVTKPACANAAETKRFQCSQPAFLGPCISTRLLSYYKTSVFYFRWHLWTYISPEERWEYTLLNKGADS